MNSAARTDSAARQSDSSPTNPSIFLRLNRTDAAVRELAWDEFQRRYAPAIAAFARRLGSGGGGR